MAQRSSRRFLIRKSEQRNRQANHVASNNSSLPGFNRSDLHSHKDMIHPTTEALIYSERLKSNKSDINLHVSDNHLKHPKSNNDSGTKIKVLERFDAKPDQSGLTAENLTKSAQLAAMSDISRRST